MKNLYAEARITSIIKNYFESTIDSEKKFEIIEIRKIQKRE